MLNIKILSNDLINKISAGPLILKPLYVVKELIENSIDANSTFISIILEKGGKKKILVRDNGEGITKENLLLTITPHATSKLNSYEDLFKINTLGFRGEALSSISSISKFNIISRSKNKKIAWSLTKNIFSNNIEIIPVTHPIGTSVEVLDIFFNISIKRKLLNSITNEFNLLHNLIKQFALLYNNISFELIHNNKIIKLYNNKINKSLILNINKNIIDVLGLSLFNKFIFLNDNILKHNIYITGYISNFYFSYNKKYNIQYYYINNRLIFNEPIIKHAINLAYNCFFKNKDCIIPSFIIQINMNKLDLDINIHPTKTKIKFRYEKLIHDYVYDICLLKLHNYFNKKIINKNNISYTKKIYIEKTLSLSLSFIKIDKFLIFYLKNRKHLYKKKKDINLNINHKKLFFGKPLTLINNNFLLTKNNDQLILINLSKADLILKKIQLFPNKKIIYFKLTKYIVIKLNNKFIITKNLLKLKFFGFNFFINHNILNIISIPIAIKYQNINKLLCDLIDFLSIKKTNIITIYNWLLINSINKNDIWNNFNTLILLKELEFLNFSFLKKMVKLFFYYIDNYNFIKIITNND